MFTYLGFTKFANPFASQYTVHAIFSNASGVKPASPVRIAGVNVGKVTSVGPVPGCKLGGSRRSRRRPAAQVHGGRRDDDDLGQGLPIHKDATFAIRPRIFLEGNFFVDVSPGHARGAGRPRAATRSRSSRAPSRSSSTRC